MKTAKNPGQLLERTSKLMRGRTIRVKSSVCVLLLIAATSASNAILAQTGSAAPSTSAASATKLPDDLCKLYDYDPKQPLDVQTTKLYSRDGHTVYDITYTSPRGGRVPAYLVVPDSKGPFAGIVFGHWGNGNRTEFLPEAELYAQAGAISILPEYPWMRPGDSYRGVHPPRKPEEDVATQAQAVIDLRCAFDLLIARPDVDGKRLAYVGHSYGAQWGAILMAVDGRMKAAVLAGGVPSLHALIFESNNPEVRDLQSGSGRQVGEKYAQGMAVEDAERYIPYHDSIPVLFQFAKFEQYVREPASHRLYAAATEPKQQKWYDTGHDLNDIQVLLDRANWLHEQISIRPIAPLLRKKLR